MTHTRSLHTQAAAAARTRPEQDRTHRQQVMPGSFPHSRAALHNTKQTVRCPVNHHLRRPDRGTHLALVFGHQWDSGSCTELTMARQICCVLAQALTHAKHVPRCMQFP